METVNAQAKGYLWHLLQGQSIPMAFLTNPSTRQQVSNLKETNNLTSNNPINLFQYTTGSLMWKKQISKSLQCLFLEIAIC